MKGVRVGGRLGYQPSMQLKNSCITYSWFSVCAVFLNTWFLCIFSPTFSDSTCHDHTYMYLLLKKNLSTNGFVQLKPELTELTVLNHFPTILYLSSLHCLLERPNILQDGAECLSWAFPRSIF